MPSLLVDHEDFYESFILSLLRLQIDRREIAAVLEPGMFDIGELKWKVCGLGAVFHHFSIISKAGRATVVVAGWDEDRVLRRVKKLSKMATTEEDKIGLCEGVA